MQCLKLILGSILCLFFYIPISICIAGTCEPLTSEEFIFYKARVSEGLVSLYLFSEGNGDEISATNGQKSESLYISNAGNVTWLSEGGLSVNDSVKISTNGAASAIINACMTSNEITLETWIKPENLSQAGPARIVSISDDLYNRNISLGQEGNFYDVRLRTTGTSPNGIPSISTAAGTVTTDLTHIVYTRDTAGSARIYINGEESQQGNVDGNMSGWDDSYRLNFANEDNGDRSWLGEIHLVAVYDKALSYSEVVQNFQAAPKGEIDESPDSSINPYFGNQSSSAYLEWDFDFVETFDNLANWVNHDGRAGNVTDISKMPKLEDGSDSPWGYYSMWSDNAQTQNWISNYGDNRVWRGTKSACIDFEGNGGPSRFGLYFGDPSNDHPENTGYDDIYIFYMVNIRANNWPTHIDENKVGTYTPGEGYEWISSWKFNTLNMGAIAPHKYISTTDGRYSTYHIVPHLKADNYTQDGQIIVTNSLRDGENEVFPARGKSVDEYLDNWWGVEFHFRNVMEGDEQVTYQDVWVYGPDGQTTQALTNARIVFESQSISNKWNEFYFGGNNSNTYIYGPTMQGDYYVDDFIIDDQRIGPKYFRMIQIMDDTESEDDPDTPGDPEDIWLDFDNFVVTDENEIPEDSISGAWKYASGFDTNDFNERISTCGWYNENTYPSSNTQDYFKWYLNGYNSDHMGYSAYGYLDIDDTMAVRGNSLRLVTTGGHNATGRHGIEMTNKESYLELIGNGVDPVSGDDVIVGAPTMYFLNTSLNHSPEAMPQAKNANRLSFYVYMPKDATNEPQYPHNQNRPPSGTISIGPFNGAGGHWYHTSYNQGGGWTRIMIDGHPHHNNAFHNAESYPYPSYSLRDMGTDYFNDLYRWYIAFTPYNGIAKPKFDIWIDEIDFYYDDLLEQNNETINTPSITYHPESLSFEVSFSAKYKNNPHDLSDYEIRYAFSQINNDNYDAAKPCIIQNTLYPDAFRRVSYNEQGLFGKNSNYYPGVWAPFKLHESDIENLKPGTIIYFAIKDVSDRQKYLDHPEAFDVEGDRVIVEGTGKERIDLIKRIDYRISEIASTIPGSEFVADTLEGDAPLSVKFIDQSINAASWEWDFDSDGQIDATEQHPSYTYTDPGEYTVTLIITNSDQSQTSSRTKTSYIKVKESLDNYSLTTAIDFGIDENENTFGLSGWTTAMKDKYTDYRNIGPGGTTIVVGTNRDYDYQGVQGSSMVFEPNDMIKVTWYNHSNETITIRPRISFNDPDRVSMGFEGTWYFMEEARIPANGSGYSLFKFDESSSGNYTLINVNGNYPNRELLICDKIELLSENDPDISDAIIVDHTCTEITKIPETAIINAKNILHIAYGHTSHGSQLISGMNGLDDFLTNSPKFDITPGLFVWNDGPQEGYLDIDDYAMKGDVGYYPQWVNNTRSYLGDPDPATGRGSSHSDVNVIVWSWCGQVDSKYASGKLDSDYLTPMSQLEEDYPGITFVYMTGHVDHWDDANNKEANQMIRDYVIANNKVLYDFADIESYDPDGNYYEYPHDNCDYYASENGALMGNWCTEWQNSNEENVDWWASGAAHSHHINGNLKGYAAWWLWARLGGWEGKQTPESDILIADFGASSSENEFGLSGWNTVYLSDVASYSSAGTGGISFSEAVDEYSGYVIISGTDRLFKVGEQIALTWHNASSTTRSFYPLISFMDLDAPDNAEGEPQWYATNQARYVYSGNIVTTYYDITDENTAPGLEPPSQGTYSHIAISYSGGPYENLILDKVEIRIADIEPPQQVTGLVTTSVLDHSITFNWDKSSDNTAVEKYEIYINGSIHGLSDINQYTAYHLDSETEYTVYVAALDEKGNVGQASDSIIVKTLAFQGRDNLIDPKNDLAYMGAFRLPSGDGGSWNYRGKGGSTFFPMGDPENVHGDAEYPGSIYSFGAINYDYIAEISIPEPVISPTKNLDDLNVATNLKSFSNDCRPLNIPGRQLNTAGIEYIPATGAQNEDLLYLVWGDYYMVSERKVPTHSACSLDLTAPSGIWFIGPEEGEPPYNTIMDYLFKSPDTWASENLGGKSLITGSIRSGNYPAGPSMHAIAPWLDQTPLPDDGSELSYITLLQYDRDYGSHQFNGFVETDYWAKGAWLTSGKKSAVMFSGTKGFGKYWYGYNDGTVYDDVLHNIPTTHRTPDGSSKGGKSDRFEGMFVFYDPDELKAVVDGEMDPNQPQPYAALNIEDVLFDDNTDSASERYKRISDVSYDREHGILYVFEPLNENARSIVHVWKIKDDKSPILGDIDNNGEINLTDAIIVLKIVSKISVAMDIHMSAVLNDDGIISLDEVIYILRYVSN
jgi:PKD repeat protein